MIVVIGHGPSIVGKGLGEWIDRQTVIRLKSAPMPNPEDWGTRTDYLSTTKPDYWVCSNSIPGERWVFGHKTKGYRRPDVERWLGYFSQFHTGNTGIPAYRQYRHRTPAIRKPSNGLCAVFCAVEFLNPQQIGLIGFDSILNPTNRFTGKWHDTKPSMWSHDQLAENAALYSLGIEVVKCS